MKKTIYCCVLLFVSTTLNAQYINADDALQLFYDFFEIKEESRNSEITDTKIFIYPENSKKDETCLYFISDYNYGWVIIPSDKRFRNILAYSTKGTLSDYSNLPPALKDMINNYLYQIRAIQSIPNHESDTSHRTLLSTLSSIDIIVPNLLQKDGQTIRWKQDGNDNNNTVGCTKTYNKYCPNLFSDFSFNICADYSYVGCTAIAIAQVMWYWQWPYYAKVPLIMLDTLGNTTGNNINLYDWSLMTPFINQYTDIQSVNMVAKLLKDCGYASKMKYKKTGSYAHLNDAAEALKNNFSYSSELYHAYRPTSNLLQWVWLNKIKVNLDLGRPIPYCGYDGTSSSNLTSGHSFVLTGYNSANYFCVNWGWGHGYEEAWVSLDSMPLSLYNFKYYQQAIFDVKPTSICSYEIPTTNSTWTTNLIELYHGDAILQNRNIDNNSKGIIYSDNSIRLLPGTHIQAGANVHLAIRDMNCYTTTSNNEISNQQNIKPNYTNKYHSNINQLNLIHNSDNKHLTIQSPQTIISIQIYNITGQCVMQTRQTDIDTSNLPAGVYIITANTITGETLQNKFINY